MRVSEGPIGKKVVGSKWEYMVKYQANRSIERYNVKLIIKGYTQIYGLDCLQNFTHAIKMNIVKIILSLVTNFSWDLQQFNVKKKIIFHRYLEQ